MDRIQFSLPRSATERPADPEKTQPAKSPSFSPLRIATKLPGDPEKTQPESHRRRTRQDIVASLNPSTSRSVAKSPASPETQPEPSPKKPRRSALASETFPRLRGGQSTSPSHSPISPIGSSFDELNISRTPTPVTSIDNTSQPARDSATGNIADTPDGKRDADSNLDDTTDIEDAATKTRSTVNVPINYKDAAGVLTKYHLDVKEKDLIVGQARGYAYVGIEHVETEEEAIAREEEGKKTDWMAGWLARKNPEKYQVRPKRWVAGADSNGGGRWVEVDPDPRLRVITVWRKAHYRNKRWFLDQSIEGTQPHRMARLSSPPLHYKLEVDRLPLRPGDRKFDPLTWRARRFPPPLMGTFSVEQERLYEDKAWVARRWAEMVGADDDSR